ncbi:MAG TPA: tetratricopeptide repeat protein, partial [Anaeromyxobacteraceae bacterium]|nr:tetratricopeptide repeat protein [Anaeromyxobacteraceae bacterium]
EDSNLAQHVASLRRILGDDAHQPSYIETVPRRGYRFVAPVARAARAILAAPPPEPAQPDPAPVTGAPVAPEAVAAPPVVPDEQPPGEPHRGAGEADAAPPSADVASPPAPPSPVPATAAEREPAPPPAVPQARRPRLARRAAFAAAALVALGLGWGMLRPGGWGRRSSIRSIVVLPFANLTGDSHLDDVAAALTSEVTSGLAGVPGVHVKAADATADDAHRAEGVDVVVETALLRGEGRLRLAAEILEASSNRLLWAEAFDADPVAEVEAGRRVARALAEQITALSHGDPSDWLSVGRAAAHREYSLAREYLSRRTPHVVQEALEHFTAAAQLDPGFALALVGVAEAYLLGAEQRVLPPAEALAAAETSARRALELNADLAQTHGVLGEVAAARGDFEAAEQSYRRALELDPTVARVHERYAALLDVLDRHEEAIAEARMARDLDPTCPSVATGLAAAYYHAGQSDEAVQRALEVLRLTPRFPAAYDVLGWAHLAKGRHPEAIAAFKEAVRLSGRNPAYLAALARAHARAGHRHEAHRLLAELERSAPSRAASPLDVAEVLAALGEPEQALQQVERAIAEGTPWLPHVDAGLGMPALHDHARFRDLVARMRAAARQRNGHHSGVPGRDSGVLGRAGLETGGLPVPALSALSLPALAGPRSEAPAGNATSAKARGAALAK